MIFAARGEGEKVKTEILKIKGDWQEVVNDCCATIGKPETGKEPSSEWKRRILIAEHSPIRDIVIKWRWAEIPSFVATHFSRHMWECFIKTQRTDRTGIDRRKLPQDAIVSFVGNANIQNLIDTMRKRLCYQEAPETREYAEDLKREISKVEAEIGFVLVPQCVSKCGCPEMKPCGYYMRILEHDWNIGSHDIQERYEAYNSAFYGEDDEPEWLKESCVMGIWVPPQKEDEE